MSASSPGLASGEIEKKVKAELEPVFLDFYKGSAKGKVYVRNAKWFARRICRSGEITILLANTPIVMQTVNESIAKHANAPNDESMFKLKASRKTLGSLNALSYMAFVEGVATPYIDLSILLLSTGGSPFHVGPDYKHNYIRHATSFRDLESPSISLANKLDFLESYGLTFFSQWVDIELRNTIAHLKFDIDDKGSFFKIERVREKSGHLSEKRVEINILGKLGSFIEYHGAVSRIFAYELNRT